MVREPLSPPPNFHQVANPQWVSDFYYARVPKDSEFLGTLWGRKTLQFDCGLYFQPFF